MSTEKQSCQSGGKGSGRIDEGLHLVYTASEPSIQEKIVSKLFDVYRDRVNQFHQIPTIVNWQMQHDAYLTFSENYARWTR